MKIIFVRHGQTTWNIEGRLQGQINDSKLTEVGIEQARQLSNKIENLDYDIIISSPFDRTLDTAKIINEKKQKDIITNDLLKERSYGKLEGEYANNGTYNIHKMWNYSEVYNENNVEPINIFFERVYKFLDNLIEENKYEQVLIVSHSGVGIAMKTYFEGMPKNNRLLDLGINNCEILTFDTKCK